MEKLCYFCLDCYQCSVNGIKNRLTTNARPHSIPTTPKFVLINLMMSIANNIKNHVLVQSSARKLSYWHFLL